jgi:phage-related protein
MKRRNHLVHYGFILLTCGALVSGVAPTGAQSQTQALAPQAQDRDENITRRQLAGFDNFLDSHPEVAEQLRKDPSLVNNQKFVESHGDLQQYLQQHPEVREELSQNPNGFMRQEQRFDRREDQARDRDLTRGELANMDRFMDTHPEIAEQLRKNPSLVDDKQFEKNHPALQQFLAEHPGVREEYKENPNAFMNQEQRFDQRQDQARGDRDVTRGELANMDRFMDSHPEIAEQLRKNPSLVDDKQFEKNHPALQQFLAEHPGVREEYKENPNAFMNQEQRFDQRQDSARGDRDVTRGELANMDRFMDSHPEIAEQLRKNPSLVDDKQFEKNHPALQQFLAEHPGVREEYKENPNAFMRQEQRFDQRQDQARGDRDVTRGELANMDRFMDTHPEIAEQLRKNPSLVDDKQFEKNHPALQQFLAEHPGVREEYKENPNAFMNQEQRFDQRQDSTMHRDRDLNRGELSNFSEFLEGHNNIAGELSKNPSLANNKEYLENHPALRDYLVAHPQVHQELSENPQTFLQATQQFNTHSTAKVGESKLK